MAYIEYLKKLGQGFLDLVFPISCLVCGKDDVYLCESCALNLPKLEKQECLVCQKPAPFGKTHPDCASKNQVDGALSALTHKDKHVRNLIWTFKYNFVSSLSPSLSKLIVEAIASQGLADYFNDFVVVPVPLHPRRLNWRGFNQASLLGQSLAQDLGTKIDEHLVARNKFTQPQTKLNAQERKRNLENAFALVGDAANKKILLIDDVVTSGSTANELAKLLKRGHAAEVWIVSAAHG